MPDARAKPQQQIEEWIRAMYAEIFRYCLFHCADRGEAEDATQDTFLKAVRYGASPDKLQNERAFLYKIARNTCIDMARRKRAAALPEQLLAEDAGQRQAEENADFLLLVSVLPAEQQELLQLRFQQRLSIAEIAQVLGLPPRTAQSRLRAALKKLKQSLRSEDEGYDG